MESYQAKKNLTQALIHLFLIVFSITMLVPFLWMVLTAFKTQAESTSIDPFVFFPSSWSFESFTTVWTSYNFLYLYKNTLLMILFRVLCAVLTATMAGYAFGRLNFPGKNILFSLVLIQMMVPSQIFIIPQYIKWWYCLVYFGAFLLYMVIWMLVLWGLGAWANSVPPTPPVKNKNPYSVKSNDIPQPVENINPYSATSNDPARLSGRQDQED